LAYKFFGVNKLLFKKADANLPHPYGLGDPNHILTKPGIPDKKLEQNTPDWDNLNSRISEGFGGKTGLHDIASAYHIPGMERQKLNVSSGINNPNEFFVNYQGTYPGAALGQNFRLSTGHGINHRGEHAVNWDFLGNQTGNPNALGHFIRQAFPAYQKMGVHHIDTDAYGENEKMNGNHTWSSLGFDFADPNHRENTRHNALQSIAAHGNNDENLRGQALAATHPFHFQHIARQLSKNTPDLNAKQHFNKMLKHPYSIDDNPNYGSFEARLNMDPQDAGYQRFQNYLKRFSR
jgi:hypothetical protein